MPKNLAFDQDRIEKVSKIMPQFTKVAAVGDKVLMGLEGDPSFPFAGKTRTSAEIIGIDNPGTENAISPLNSAMVPPRVRMRTP